MFKIKVFKSYSIAWNVLNTNVINNVLNSLTDIPTSLFVLHYIKLYH